MFDIDSDNTNMVFEEENKVYPTRLVYCHAC